MDKLIVANWKMNPETKEEATRILNKVIPVAKKAKAEVVICPPFVYFPLVKEITLGSQDAYSEDKGAFTGEISPEMVKSLGAKYVILGHSERRIIFRETNQIINKKIRESLEAGLKIIFCIGETKKEKKAGKREKVLEEQIKEGLTGVKDKNNIIVAYEPVWSIGTGKNCSPEEAKEVIQFIKSLLGNNIMVLYGGSVDGKNARDYLNNNIADGLLVGGSSLNPDEFIDIINSSK